MSFGTKNDYFKKSRKVTVIDFQENLLVLLVVLIDLSNVQFEDSFEFDLALKIFLVFNQIENDVHVHLSFKVLLQIIDERPLITSLLESNNSKHSPNNTWQDNNKVIKSDVVTGTFIHKLLKY